MPLVKMRETDSFLSATRPSECYNAKTKEKARLNSILSATMPSECYNAIGKNEGNRLVFEWYKAI